MVSLIFHDKQIENFLLCAMELLCKDCTNEIKAYSEVVFCDTEHLSAVSDEIGHDEESAQIVLVSREKSDRRLCRGGTRFVLYPCGISSLASVFPTHTSEKNKSSDFEFDRESGNVTLGRKTACLTEREARLFDYLLGHAGECVSREEITSSVWEENKGTNVADVYISYLRKKLEPVLGAGVIRSVRGKGYILDI